MTPLFSIAIPVYNRADYLRNAIQSCLMQTDVDLEIVISDDCSSVDLASVAKSFQDPRIRYFRSPTRLGASKNHQSAVSLARGTYVLTLNSDDLLLPDCLQTAGQALRDNETAAAAYFSLAYLTGSNIEGCHPVPSLRFADASTLAAHPWLEKFHGTSPSSCLFRKAVFDRLGGYRTSLRFAYDWDLYMRFMTVGGGVVFVPKVLGIYRKHDEQMVAGHSIDGLKDMLKLWSLDEYSHWPAWEIADLVLSECSAALRKGGDAFAPLREVHRLGLGPRAARGLPQAIAKRALRRLNSSRSEVDQNCETPEGAENAVGLANQLFRSLDG